MAKAKAIEVSLSILSKNKISQKQMYLVNSVSHDPPLSPLWATLLQTKRTSICNRPQRPTEEINTIDAGAARLSQTPRP